MLDRYVGAIHTTDIPYAFDNLRFKDMPWTALDRKLAVVMSTYWSNFSKTGDPNAAGLPNWPAYDPKEERLMNLGDEIRKGGFNRAGIDFLADHEERERQAGRTLK